MKVTTYLTTLLSAAVLLSCMPEIDTDKFTNYTYRGEWGIPLVNSRVSLQDVLAEDTLFTIDPDGGLRLIYESDSVFGFAIDDFAAIPGQDPLETTVPLDVPSLNVSTSLGTIGGAKFKQLRIREGSLKLEVDNPTANSVDLSVTINNADISGQTFSINLTATPGISSQTVDVAGLDIDLSNNGLTENYLSFEIDILSNGGATAGQTVDLALTYEELLVGRAVGYFGQRTVAVPSGNFQLGVEAFENFLNGLYLADPTIELVVSSNVGLPLQLDLDLDGVSTAGQLESLGLAAINITGPSVIGNYDTTNILIDRTTSNIVDFIANVPNTILYSGAGIMNPQGETGTDNFITADGEMQVGLRIDLPLALRTQNLIFQQEIGNLDFGGLTEQTDAVEELTLKFHVENEFPFDADMKLQFYQNDVLTDSVLLDLFDAAPVDGNGRSTGYQITDEDEVLSGDKINRLLQADRLVMTITLNTTNNGNTTVKLYEDYDILVQLGVDAKLNYDL
ncbi:hypothetical protein [Phaeocystidibacter luteus]|uniref:Uncharacterized protein n=1 Tax=Phaeocystidibacter luteus TaxID=911197 RepID=A0A6N6RLF2_9FLAO|nr:hypothetical protein [Phaeocystidibacter luteus]KAB2814404.1 hypothetical protein F8C67_01330 [Phaeocystidibacter luteus]